jgi:hypothetical protein
MKMLLVFIAVCLAVGAAALGAGYAIAGESALIQGGTAFALAFVPATATLAFVALSYRGAPDMRLMASMGGTGIRMAIGLGGGYFLTSSWPETFGIAFWYWLLVFYMGMLAFEITLIVRTQPDETNIARIPTEPRP